MDKTIEAIITIATAVVGLAIVSVLVSNRAQTGSIVGSAGTAFSGALRAAEAPITG